MLLRNACLLVPLFTANAWTNLNCDEISNTLIEFILFCRNTIMLTLDSDTNNSPEARRFHSLCKIKTSTAKIKMLHVFTLNTIISFYYVSRKVFTDFSVYGVTV